MNTIFCRLHKGLAAVRGTLSVPTEKGEPMYTRPKYYKVHTDGHEVALEPIYEELVPVVHGQWVQVICYEEFEDGFVDRVKECCSVCHIPNGQRASNYCPNCGAKMDLEAKL